jgi:hypothetical protein
MEIKKKMNSNGPLSSTCSWPNGPFDPWRLMGPSGHGGPAGPHQPAWPAHTRCGHRSYGRCGGAAAGVLTVADPQLDPSGGFNWRTGKVLDMVSVVETHQKGVVHGEAAMAASMVGGGGGPVLKDRGGRRR